MNLLLFQALRYSQHYFLFQMRIYHWLMRERFKALTESYAENANPIPPIALAPELLVAETDS